MPEKRTIKKARRRARRGQSPSTQAGEFVREEIRHVREGKHGARSAKQAIAIGLSKARRAGVKLPPPPGGKGRARPSRRRPSARRSRAIQRALRREKHSSVSHAALARQAHRVAVRRGPWKRHEAAMKAVRTKGPAVRKAAARKAAKTRARHDR
ncbi:MAG: DNA-binding protein [Planctomycetes bacterium]|nr:DNA-binding protein [Planctomycetota bacterium]